MPRKPEPTNEREQNQACLYFAERGGGRRSQPRDANGTDSGNYQPPTVAYPQGWTTSYIQSSLCRYL